MLSFEAAVDAAIIQCVASLGLPDAALTPGAALIAFPSQVPTFFCSVSPLHLALTLPQPDLPCSPFTSHVSFILPLRFLHWPSLSREDASSLLLRSYSGSLNFRVITAQTHLASLVVIQRNHSSSGYPFVYCVIWSHTSDN